MVLVGRAARNHPQQKTLDSVDDRKAPPELFDGLHAAHRFTVDAAASTQNAQLPRFWTRETDGLAQDWTGERVWCNPPYSSLRPWVEKAWMSGAELVVMILPANRTEQGWWQDLVEPWRDLPDRMLSTRFLRGRRRFIAPGADGIGPDERPPFGIVVLTWTDPQPIPAIQDRLL